VYSVGCQDVKFPELQLDPTVGEGKLASGSVTALMPVVGVTLVLPVLS
jgi:hypothetical protein